MPLLTDPIERAAKLRPNTLKALDALGIISVGDALQRFPYRHVDFSTVKPINELAVGEQASIRATVKQIKKSGGFRGILSRAEAVLSDESGSIKAVWFNQPYLADQFKPGEEVFIAGKVNDYRGLQFANPIYEKVVQDETSIHTSRLVPIYSLGGKIPQRTFRALLFELMPAAEQFVETLPLEAVENERLMPRFSAIQELHFPSSAEQLHEARRRMAFEEIFTEQLSVELRKEKLAKSKAIPIPFKKTLIAGFTKSLPFALTAEQKQAAWDIFQDLERSVPMNRLLEGDVGSGKTLVALSTALGVCAAGKQSAMLCPTEILAEQHYQTALKYFADYPQFSIILLTAKKQSVNGRPTKKKDLIEEIAHGGPQLVIGTHAALQKDVIFPELAYVIIDEQHRFGVRQRAELQHRDSAVPHLLSMTATPIPRTLQLAALGDLEISRISKLPTGRKPILTKLVLPADRLRAYGSVAKQIAEGRQAFVVVPLIDAPESDDGAPLTRAQIRLREAKSAIAEVENLKKIFPKLKIGLLHGRMKTPEQEETMREFLDNKLQILVSTTVIEVGVDVPNASIMLVENAERFGLAQLHQLRGRVGRAEYQSYCLLFANNPSMHVPGAAFERLKAMESISSGFELAEIDLKNRGYGTLYGTQQSGMPEFEFYDLSDESMALRARESAKRALERDPKLSSLSEIRKRAEQRIVHLE